MGDFHFTISTEGKTYEFALHETETGSNNVQSGSRVYSVIPKNSDDTKAIELLLKQTIKNSSCSVNELAHKLKQIPSVTNVTVHSVSENNDIAIRYLEFSPPSSPLQEVSRSSDLIEQKLRDSIKLLSLGKDTELSEDEACDHLDKAIELLEEILSLQTTEAVKKEVIDTHRSAMIEEVARFCENHYVFPEIGKRCADKIRSTDYSYISDPETFTQTITSDIRSIAEDKHIEVFLPTQNSLAGIASLSKPPYGIEEVSVVDEVAYMRISVFANVDRDEDGHIIQDKGAAKALEEAMNTIRSAKKGIILDLRNNGGGSFDMVQLLCSYFLPPDTKLSTMEWRRGSEKEISSSNTVSYNEISKKSRILEIPLFILCNNKTFSAAEECTNNMKTVERALVIGGLSGGGANFCELFSTGSPFKEENLNPLSPRIKLSLPVAESINPYTKTNWDGIGVIPDIITTDDENPISVVQKLMNEL